MAGERSARRSVVLQGRLSAAGCGCEGWDLRQPPGRSYVPDDAKRQHGCGARRQQAQLHVDVAKGELPPVNAFWSVTMYDGKTQLLIENPINRYLINSPMLPSLKRNADGSLTIYIEKSAPAADKKANWLPAPNGTIYMVMRLYWPKEPPQPSILPRAMARGSRRLLGSPSSLNKTRLLRPSCRFGERLARCQHRCVIAWAGRKSYLRNYQTSHATSLADIGWVGCGTRDPRMRARPGAAGVCHHAGAH